MHSILVDNALMEVVAVSDDDSFLLDWAATLPWGHDYTILEARYAHLVAYSDLQLRTLFTNLNNGRSGDGRNRPDLETLIVSSLAGLPVTEESPPPDKERHPVIPSGHYPDGTSPEERESAGVNEMAATKKTTSKKTTAKKAAPKKAAPKKTAAKKQTKKVERERQNGVLRPLPGSKAGKVWDIADKMSKKAGNPAKRSDVLEEAAKDKSLSPAGASADFQTWRKFHGLVKSA